MGGFNASSYGCDQDTGVLHLDSLGKEGVGIRGETGWSKEGTGQDGEGKLEERVLVVLSLVRVLEPRSGGCVVVKAQ